MRLDWAISDKKRAKHSLHRRKRLRRFHAPRGYGHLHKVQPQLCEVAGMESFSGLVCKWVSSLQRPYVPLKVYCLRGGERQDRKPGRGRDCRIIPPLCKIMLGAFRFVPGSMSRHSVVPVHARWCGKTGGIAARRALVTLCRSFRPAVFAAMKRPSCDRTKVESARRTLLSVKSSLILRQRKKRRPIQSKSSL